MHVPINVKSPNNISEWQMGFNSAFKELTYTNLSHKKSKNIRTQEKITMWKSRILHGRHAYDLEDSDERMESNAWLKVGTFGFMIAILDQVIISSNYEQYILKDLNSFSDTCRKCQEKSKAIQRVTGACCALTQGDYSHNHTQVAIIHQELVIKCGILKGKSIPYYEPQAVLEDL
jgi:hypothetical protein